jgi:hypothetical protein
MIAVAGNSPSKQKKPQILLIFADELPARKQPEQGSLLKIC